ARLRRRARGLPPNARLRLSGPPTEDTLRDAVFRPFRRLPNRSSLLARARGDLQREVARAVQNVVGPIERAHLEERAPRATERGADGLAAQQGAIQLRGESLGSGVSHGPVTTDVVRHAAAQERLGEAHVLLDALGAERRLLLAGALTAHAAGLAGVEEDERRQARKARELGAREHLLVRAQDSTQGRRLLVEKRVAGVVQHVELAGPERREQGGLR